MKPTESGSIMQVTSQQHVHIEVTANEAHLLGQAILSGSIYLDLDPDELSVITKISAAISNALDDES